MKPDLGYPTHSWPADCDRGHYLAVAQREYPNTTDKNRELFAQVYATMCVGTRQFVRAEPRPAVFDGEMIDAATADELRRLAA